MFNKDINFKTIIRTTSNNEEVIQHFVGLLDLNLGDIVKLTIRTPENDTENIKNTYFDVYGKVLSVYNNIYKSSDDNTYQTKQILIELFEESNNQLRAIRNKVKQNTTNIEFE